MYHNSYSSVHQRNLVFSQYIFFKILGLSPWELNFSTKDSKNATIKFIICKFSIFGSFYNISLATAAITLTLYFCHEHNFRQIDSLVTSSITTNFEFLSIIVMSLFIITCTFHQKKMIKIFNGLNSIDNRLQKFAFNSSKSGNIIIALIFIVNIIICIVLITLGFYQSSFFQSLLRCTTSIFYSWMIVQYVIILDMIEKRFKFINLNILKLGNIEEDSKMPQPFSIHKISIPLRSLLYDVINIRHTYNKLCEICEEVANFYGLPILIAMTYNGILITLVSYFMLLSFIGIIKLDLILCISYVITAAWFACQVILLTTYVTRTLDQIEKASNVINKVIRLCAMDEKVEKELLNFLRELSFLKVKFTACGIIPLDRSFLASIFVSIATYLILLIEFRLSTT